MSSLEQLMSLRLSELIDPAVVVLAVFVVVPGFLAMKTYDLTVPSERRNFGNSLIEVFSFSLINLVAWSWLLLFVDLRTFPEDRPLITYALSVVIILVSPVVLAVLLRKVLDAQQLGFLVPSPTGWDGFFSRRERCWVLFHLKDEEGTVVGGFFGPDSVASSHPNKQQVYVEEMYRVDQETYEFGEKVEQTRGAIISAEDCYFVELYKEEPDGTQENGGA